MIEQPPRRKQPMLMGDTIGKYKAGRKEANDNIKLNAEQKREDQLVWDLIHAKKQKKNDMKIYIRKNKTGGYYIKGNQKNTSSSSPSTSIINDDMKTKVHKNKKTGRCYIRANTPSSPIHEHMDDEFDDNNNTVLKCKTNILRKKK